MIARDKFKLGQQVKLTKIGKRVIAMDGSTHGYVSGFTREPAKVVIEPQGFEPREYHMDHWEPVHDAA